MQYTPADKQIFTLFVNALLFNTFYMIFHMIFVCFYVFLLNSVSFFGFCKHPARVYKDSKRGRAPAWAGRVSRSVKNNLIAKVDHFDVSSYREIGDVFLVLAGERHVWYLRGVEVVAG